MDFEKLQKRMEGVHVTMVTPFREDYEVDYDGLGNIVDHMVDNGVHAINCSVMTGESGSLTVEEHKKVMETVVAQAGGRIPVFAGCIHPCLRTSLELAKYAQKVGADGIILVPSYFLKLTEKEIYGYFRTFAENIDIGIMIYEFHEAQITPELANKLTEIQNVVSMFAQPYSLDLVEIRRMVDLVGDKLVLMGSIEDIILETTLVGIKAQSSSTANFAPKYFVDLYESAMKRDISRALELYSGVCAQRNLFRKEARAGHSGYYAVYTKASMELMGLPAGPPRPPLMPLTKERKIELAKVLREKMKLPTVKRE